MRDITKEIEPLHRLYCGLAQQHITLTIGRLYHWEVFVARGFTGDDLKLVIAHIKRGIRNGERNKGALRFSNLIQNLEDNFEETLAQARADKERNGKPKMETGKAQILRQSGRAGELVTKEKSAAEVIANSERMAKMLGQWKEKNL